MGKHPVEPQEGGWGLGVHLYKKHTWAKNASSSCVSITHKAWGQEACKYQLFTFWITWLILQSCHWEQSQRSWRVPPSKRLLLYTNPGPPIMGYDVLQPLPGGNCWGIAKANCAVLWYLSKKSLKWKSIPPFKLCWKDTWHLCKPWVSFSDPN